MTVDPPQIAESEALLLDIIWQCGRLIMRIRELQLGNLPHLAAGDIERHLVAVGRLAGEVDAHFFDASRPAVGHALH